MKRYAKRNLYGIGAFNTLDTLYSGLDEAGVLKGRSPMRTYRRKQR